MNFQIQSYPRKCYSLLTDPNSNVIHGSKPKNTSTVYLYNHIKQWEKISHLHSSMLTFINSACMLSPCHYLIRESTNQASSFIMQTGPKEDLKLHHWLSKSITWLFCFRLLAVKLCINHCNSTAMESWILHKQSSCSPILIHHNKTKRQLVTNFMWNWHKHYKVAALWFYK